MLLAKPAITQTDDALGMSRHQEDNPLIWPLMSLLRTSVQSWKIHHLAAELQQRGLLSQLDENPEKDLFKRNFLLMNALYELQDMLLPQQWLQVQSMEIKLFRLVPADAKLLQLHDQSLRDYYQDWRNYDTCANVVKEMLASFWHSYQQYIGAVPERLAYLEALQIMDLNRDASERDIRRQWRKLALRWHPDRPDGDAAKFREVCEAWQVLRGS
ncbi:DNA-J related domain-containing protein [Shewanella sp. A32]|uniref:DNA-J related domain-containing protein n=1 Tax=Shewanella sp. A32 TaxID=3031327 RepID=UPI0023B89074|nr:DNA-J related domain-containing protein [Shewanella sp. A32]MDF0533208.1 DNA-J related domain-containing protein [Shewanella sp. A32]